jgi:hypothetical protein
MSAAPFNAGHEFKQTVQWRFVPESNMTSGTAPAMFAA